MKRNDVQKFSFFKLLKAGIITVAVMLASSCVSRPPEYEGQALGAIGTGADVYICMPVSGNQSLLKAVLTRFVPEKTADQYLTRTSVLYAGVYYTPAASVRIVSVGSYPVGFSGFLFSQKNGWQKCIAAPLNNHVYYASATADIVLQSKTAFALLGNKNRDTAAFLQRIAEPQMPVVPPRFQTLAETGEADTIAVYIPSGSRTADSLFGLQDIELPIQSAQLYLKKQSGSSAYWASAVFEASNTRAALVLRVLLGAVLKGHFSVQGASVFVENADISETELIQLLQSIMK